MSVNWSWERAVESIPVLLEGFRITLLATVAGFLIAAVLGLLVAVVRRSAPGIVTVPLRMVTEFIRLTPLVVQLLFAYFLLPQFSALQIGIVVLGSTTPPTWRRCTARASMRYRAGDGRPRGALSLPAGRTWRAVVLPAGDPEHGSRAGQLRDLLFKDTPFLFAITGRDGRPPSNTVPGTSSTSSRSRSPA